MPTSGSTWETYVSEARPLGSKNLSQPRGTCAKGMTLRAKQAQNYLSQILPLHEVVFSALAP